ncbi:MAG: hypothetical protein ACI4SK_03825 [Christensenellales bacterium]
MNKVKKQALLTGEDSNGAKYYYYCKTCKTMNPLNVPVCSHCGKKRPRNAFEYVHVVQPAPAATQEYGRGLDRTARNAYPAAPNPCFAVPLPTNGNYDPTTYANNSAANLPTYYMTDEYGRVYRAKVTYGAMPCSAPVPVATPSKTIQTAAINVKLK